MYINKFLYQNFRATANQKSTIDTQTNKKNQLNTTLKIVIKPQEKKGRKKSNKKKSKTVNIMAIRTYISIITLNVNGLNAPTKRNRLADGYKNKTHIYAVFKKPTSLLGTHTN